MTQLQGACFHTTFEVWNSRGIYMTLDSPTSLPIPELTFEVGSPKGLSSNKYAIISAYTILFLEINQIL